jgi:hypothetical protein
METSHEELAQSGRNQGRADGNEHSLDALHLRAAHLGRKPLSLDCAEVLAERAAALVPKPIDGKPGRDGRDIDPALLNDAIDRKVADAVSKFPVPKDGAPGAAGVDGKYADPALIAQMIAEGVAQALPGAVDRAISGLVPELVRRTTEAMPRPRDGVDGKSVDEAEILSRLTESMLRAVDALPKAKDGRDAEPVDMDAIVARVAALAPVPRDGVNGKDAPAVDVDAIIETVTKRLPVVKDGAAGRDGADGQSITLDEVRPILEAETARWQLEFERRATDLMRAAIEKAIEKIPVPQNGADGKDGVPLDGFDVALEGRILKLSLTAGERVISKDIRLPIPFDKGVFRSGEKYEQSDVVTFGGSQWIALRDTVTKPPSNDWRCCVKRGQDGKDAAQ